MCSNIQSFKTIIFYPSEPAVNSLVPTSMFSPSKQMQQRENRNNNNPGPLGICQRLFNFIMDTLTARGLPRLTNPLASQSIQVPVEGSSAEPDYQSNSEIRVDSRHTNGFKHHGAKNDNATVKREKGGIRSVEIGMVRPTTTRDTKIDSRGQVNGQELDSIATGGSGGQKEKNNNKVKSTTTTTRREEEEDEVWPMTPPLKFNFLDTDINGRADEFIRQKKRDFLRRNTTLDLPKSN